MTRLVLALGANLGERSATLEHALADLRAVPGMSVRAVSPFVETVAVTLAGEDPDAPGYVNAVAILDTDLSPEDVLTATGAIERRHGRVRDVRWGPRTLDLDLIDMDGAERNSPTLTLPHPRAHERLFVLDPWFAIEPDAVLPGHGPIRELRDALLRSEAPA